MAQDLLASSKESLISCVWRAGDSEDQDKDLLVRVAGLQKRVNSQPQQVSYTKVRALIRKERDSES